MHNIRLVGALTLAAAVAACSADSTSPDLVATKGVKPRALTQRATRHSNQVKYSDAGQKPAVGRSGSATLVANALLGRDGSATLTLTSARVDGTPAGHLSHVQIKAFDPNGNLQRTTNHRLDGGPAADFTLPGRIRGSKVQVQANVAGIDANRTDVVTVVEQVKLRPDLAVTALEHLPEVEQNALVTLSMRIAELNGDVGARARCALEVDGQPVDQALAIWVDARGTVACLFVHRFAALGTRNLTVRVTDVSPGDYDLANNVHSSTITVVDPTPPLPDNDFTWDATVTGVRDNRGFTRVEGWWQDLSVPIRQEFRQYQEYDGTSFFGSSMAGTSPRSLTGPIHVAFRDWVGGTIIHDDAFQEDADTRTHFELGELRQDCSFVERTAETTTLLGPEVVVTATLIVCSSRDASGALGTFFHYFQTTSDVVYYAESWTRNIGPGYDQVWSFAGTVSNVHGTLAFGDEYRFQLTFTAGEEQLVASGVIPVTVEDRHDVTAPECTTFEDGAYSEQVCVESDLRYTFYSGMASSSPTP